MVPVLADTAVATEAAPYASALGGVTAILALVFAVIAFRAARSRSNPALHWVGLAFVVFAFKNVFTAVMVTTHIVRHDDIELVLSTSDLLIMFLLFAPFLRRRRSA